jgi:uncharacterized protein (TIGR02453 family)
MPTFSGFPAGTVKFLRDLTKHNDRDWFNKNKARFESDVREPALSFIEAMQKPMAAFSECFDVVPKKTGGSLMRIYRDTRFSKDKTPYKTNVGIQFRHRAGGDVHAPGFYIHIDPAEIFLGAGMWHPASGPLFSVRESIADDPDAWRKVRDQKAFTKHFELVGDFLKRPPRGFDGDHPMIEDLKRKDFIGVCKLAHKDIESPQFVKLVMSRFKAAKSLVSFLCDAMSLPS